MAAGEDRAPAGRTRRDSPLPAHRRPTIKDIAAAAGVSRSAASRALTGNGYVGARARERVLAVAAELGYVPHVNARALKQRVSRAVGVLVWDLHAPFEASVAAGATEAARWHGLATMLADLREGAVPVEEALEDFVAFGVAGVVTLPVSDHPTTYLGRYGIPVVEVDRQFADGRCDAVLRDHHEAARSAAEHLLAAGHRRLGVVVADDDDRAAVWLDGAAAACRPSGAVVERLPPAADEGTGAGRVTLRQVLAGDDAPTALVATTVSVAEGVWRLLRDDRYRVPQEVSVVCLEHARWMGLVTPPVTAFAVEPIALGHAAVKRLVQRFADPEDDPQRLVLPPEPARRGSVSEPPTSVRGA